jgi:hypothetical protein
MMPLEMMFLRKYALLLLLLALTTGCGRTINRTAERKIRDVLPTYIGSAKEWRAHVDNPADRTLHGSLRSVTIDGTDVHLRQIVTCDTLHIEMQNVEVDTRSQRIKSVGQTLFTATISERSLNDYLKQNPPPDDEPVRIKWVNLKPGVLHVEATRWLLGRAWPYTMNVEPRLSSPTHLDFDPDRMTALGLKVPLPKSVLRWFAKRLSEGFDFSTLPFPLILQEFHVEQGRMTLTGTADVMQSLNERISMELKRDKRQIAAP